MDLAEPNVAGAGSPLLAAFGNAVLGLFAADGALSLADHLLRRAADAALLAAPREIVARVTLVALVAAWAALASTPRLPKRVFAAPLAVTGWWSLGAPPLPLVLGSGDAFDAAGIACQVAAAALAFALLRRTHGGFRFDPARLAGPELRLRSSAAFLALHLVLAPPLLAASALLGAAAGIERATAGFVTFHAREVRLHERRYRRGEHEVRLVGMMHIGEAAAYRDLFESFRGPDTVVLEEGVSDADGLLRRRISYAAVAEALGLATQPRVEPPSGDDTGGTADPERPHVEHADVDVRAFRPETLAFLDVAASVWGAPGPAEAFAALRDFAEREDARALLAVAQEDILTLRNRHLLAAIQSALDAHRRVIVPWGALHLAEVEASLVSQGFTRESQAARTLLRYATIREALARGARGGDAEAGASAPEDRPGSGAAR